MTKAKKEAQNVFLSFFVDLLYKAKKFYETICDNTITAS